MEYKHGLNESTHRQIIFRVLERLNIPSYHLQSMGRSWYGIDLWNVKGFGDKTLCVHKNANPYKVYQELKRILG